MFKKIFLLLVLLTSSLISEEKDLITYGDLVHVSMKEDQEISKEQVGSYLLKQ